jgi:hypothetical protein
MQIVSLQRRKGNESYPRCKPLAEKDFLSLRPNGGWYLFTGDQLGTLFASRILEVHRLSGKPIGA